MAYSSFAYRGIFRRIKFRQVFKKGKQNMSNSRPQNIVIGRREFYNYVYQVRLDAGDKSYWYEFPDQSAWNNIYFKNSYPTASGRKIKFSIFKYLKNFKIKE